jgi:ribonuclease BN (tRNA processing enzyme)
MKITILGAGGAFADLSRGNSAFLIEHLDRKILVDCGTTVPLILQEMKIPLAFITDVVITHTHADHIGGLEQLAFAHKVFGSGTKPHLWTSNDVSEGLYHSLDALRYWKDGHKDPLYDYFEVAIVDTGLRDDRDRVAEWGGLPLGLYDVSHVLDMPALSVWIGDLFISGDTREPAWGFDDGEGDPVEVPKLIFHEAEFGNVNSEVHTPIADLATAYSKEQKAKTWLYHCTPQPPEAYEGFAGILEKGQTFEL